jgi:hypothetical protein
VEGRLYSRGGEGKVRKEGASLRFGAHGSLRYLRAPSLTLPNKKRWKHPNN